VQKRPRTRGVSVLLPLKDNVFDGSDYQKDGIHMNEKGSSYPHYETCGISERGIARVAFLQFALHRMERAARA
jgi:hypothetical protein